MADYAAPSFSLGLDLGFDSEPQFAVEKEEERSSPKSAPASVSETEPEEEEGEERPRILKRLRRGPAQLHQTPPSSFNPDDDDEEIEDFSSQEDSIEELHPSTQYRSMCSSSKVPLRGYKVATMQSSSQWKERKKKSISDVPTSTSVETRHCEKLFPQLTVSPLRRFQLIDSNSDSDDPSVSEDVRKVPQNIDFSSKKLQSNPGLSAKATEKRLKASDVKPQNVDLWKNFSPVKRFHIPTPVLDEVCEEYFRTGNAKDINVAEKLGSDIRAYGSRVFDETTNGRSIESSSNLADCLPPAHYYFFHNNTRIRNLVRNRLPNFFPLGVFDHGGNKQHGASVIDYMGQFNNVEPSKRQVTQQTNPQRNSKRGRTNSHKPAEEVFQASGCLQNTSAKKRSERENASGGWVQPKQGKATRKSSVKKSSKSRNVSKKSNSREALHGSGSWVDPRSCAGITNGSETTGRAGGQSAGHWYTSPEGRKVYINKSGQELTGQIAYRQYKKENGARFKKGKTKTNAKKKA